MIRLSVVPDIKKHTLQANVRENVRRGSKVYTDELLSYDGLESDYTHKVINHAEAYVDGQVHTNCMENFWSLLKRSLKGTYVAVEPFHLQRYVDEQVFRFNNRATKHNRLNDGDRFFLAMSQVGGKRLTYADLTGKNESPRQQETGTGEVQQVPF